MPGRDTTFKSSYRYGFNGKEKDPNITSGDYDYGMRIYDARVVRFLSVDPLQKKYPELTPYQFASNSPIGAIDLDGLEVYAINRANPSIVKTGPLNLALFPNSEWITGPGAPPKMSELIFGSLTSGNASSTATKPAINNSNHSENAPLAIQQQKARANNITTPPTPPKATNTATVQAPDPRQQYSDFEWGMITAPTTQASAMMVCPGCAIGVGGLQTYSGFSTGNYWEAGAGILNMAGGGLGMLGKLSSGVIDETAAQYTASMNEAKDVTLDCSEMAADINKAVSGGKIYEMTPKEGKWLNGIEYGEKTEFTYHQFYLKDGYVYDPMHGNSPVKFDEFMKTYKDLNPKGVNVKPLDQ